jgi:hypothetical protein
LFPFDADDSASVAVDAVGDGVADSTSATGTGVGDGPSLVVADGAVGCGDPFAAGDLDPEIGIDAAALVGAGRVDSAVSVRAVASVAGTGHAAACIAIAGNSGSAT